MHKTCEDCKHCIKKDGNNFCNVFCQAITSHMYCTNSFEQRSSVKDMVNHPGHYTQGGIECIEAIKAAVTGLVGIEAVCTGNIIRYIWRWKNKNGLEDLKKCRWYLDRLIKEVDHD